MKDIIYDHYITIDWSMINMAIGRMTKKKKGRKRREKEKKGIRVE